MPSSSEPDKITPIVRRRVRARGCSEERIDRGTVTVLVRPVDDAQRPPLHEQVATRRRHVDSAVQQYLAIGGVRCLERTVSREDRWQGAWRLLGDVHRHRDSRAEILGQCHSRVA